MNAVIVTYNWPPRNAIGTHRPYALARYLSEQGASVTVLTAKKQSFDEPLDLYFPELAGVEVIEVSAPATGVLLNPMLKFEVVKRSARRVKEWLGEYSDIVIDPRMAWRVSANAHAIRLAAEANLVISTYGPASAHLIGYDMKKANPDIYWVADYRDLWTQGRATMSEGARERLKLLELKTVGAKANILSAVSKDMVKHLTITLGKETLELSNGFDLDEGQLRAALERAPSKSNGPFRIVHTGTIYPGHRDPTPLLDVLVELQNDGVFCVGEVTVDFYGARSEALQRLISNFAYAPFVRWMGHVSRDCALAAQKSADLLLLLESALPEAKGVLTGKLFEYMTTGIPILCVGSRPEYEIGIVLANTGTGRVVDPEGHAQLKKLMLATLAGDGLFREFSPDVAELLKYARKTLVDRFIEDVFERMKQHTK